MMNKNPTKASPERPLVSVVIPLFNELAVLDLLFDAVHKATASLPEQFEIVLVDDGSTDGTREGLAEKVKGCKFWQILYLSRNFGQQSAYRAGLQAAKGEAVIFLEADLQDPPELIPELLSRWRAGFRVVTACRTSRAERGPRRWAFDLFHLFFHRLTEGMMPYNSGMYALVDRKVADHLIAAPEVDIFLPALKCWYGYPQTVVYYAREERAAGKPKQSFLRLFKYALNGIFSFSEVPLQWIAILGLIISLAGFGYAFALLVIKAGQLSGFFLDWEVRGFTTLAVAVFCLGGVQLTCLGIIGQYIARMYRELKQRPHFIVERKLTSNESTGIHQTS
jgi:glycosyltransferase involved in cell wall biosynthesis